MLRLALLFFCLMLFGEPAPSPLSGEVPTELGSIAPTDEPSYDDSDASALQHATATITASTKPNSVYIYQPFSITLRADTGLEIGLDASVEVSSSGIKWLNPQPQITQNGSLFETTLEFIATSPNAQISLLSVQFARNGEFFASANATPNMPSFKDFGAKTLDNFARLVGEGVEISKIKTTQYDDKSNIVNFDLSVKNGDLTLFEIPMDLDAQQGIHALKIENKSQIANYFIITLDSMQEIVFSYFNTKSKSFEPVKISIQPVSQAVSTQVGLNPKEGEFAFYKEIALYFVVAILLIIFIIFRKIYLLLLAALVGAYILYDAKPFSEVTLSGASEVKILPMERSTTFELVKSEQRVKVLYDGGEWVKVLLSNDTIGWVKKENIR